VIYNTIWFLYAPATLMEPLISPPAWLLPALAVAVGLAVPFWAGYARGRTYGIFAAVVLAFSFPAGVVLAMRLQGLLGPVLGPLVGWGFAYGLAVTGVHFAFLVRARLRTRAFRWAVSVPAQAFVALGAFSLPFLLALAPFRAGLWAADAAGLLAALHWLDLIPLVVIGFSLATSLRPRREIVRVTLGGPEPESLTRLPVERRSWGKTHTSPDRPLRIVQITDPHLGPWAPIHRLRQRIDELLDHEPDLVLLTGDFLTMEGNGTPGALAEAFAPLRRASGRAFAIFGNHDHEAPEEVSSALKENGVHLLVDDEVVAETPVGRVQIVGADWYRKDRAERVQALLTRFPRRPEHLRLLLLHDPRNFHDVPKGEVDLTLSGHTHGGQIGLVSLGLDWTVLSRSQWPDHGLFGHGASRLYVHRGTGFYGFPLRIGVPGEASILELVPQP
jgi:predicted MPP superfamily phosphohydrolase